MAEDAGYNGVFMYMNKLPNLIKSLLYYVGEGESSPPATAKLLFGNVVSALFRIYLALSLATVNYFIARAFQGGCVSS